MSEEMAKGDSAAEESALNGEAALEASVTEGAGSTSQAPNDPAPQETDEATDAVKDEKMDTENLPDVSRNTKTPPLEYEPDESEGPLIKEEPESDVEDKRGTKRRASEAFSDGDGDKEFKGFEVKEDLSLTVDYIKVLDRLEAEVAAAIVDFTPLKSVMATPPVPMRASKRSRQDTDGSRPSSALSSRSESDALSTEAVASPRGGHRRTTIEMSSPLLRVPMERGWKRELVYRAALDAHSRRNADIYYYTPAGKKLRSTREVSEQLSGTGLTLENFSFFKEPLGLDDPEKEIIRDAKVMGRGKTESPGAASGPRAPAARVPTPETPKSPPGKLKVKSMGSRLSTSNTTPKTTPKPQKKAAPTPTADNNNSAAWKKPTVTTYEPDSETSAAETSAPMVPVPIPVPVSNTPGPVTNIPVPVPVVPVPVVSMPPAPVTPPLQVQTSTPVTPVPEGGTRVQQPCSMSCGGGRVPSLCCRSCLCLYHPHCVQHQGTAPFLCKNCRSGDSPPTSKSRAPPATSAGSAPTQHNRVTLKMKVAASGGADGQRVWSVTKPPTQPPAPPAPPAQPPTQPPVTPKSSLPQSIAIVNGRRFIVVPRAMAAPTQ